ncbi:hypothetical protein C7H85_04345 [Zobellella endophytica]|uniref:Sulfotransferase family protein n=1 Tax=Zobellella endophytica TaxID=2116700 RepID=A0A2P7RCS4_9GAMM|nr:sulfotransferase family 2 domain-containing protein [Zobellella endophytica]PSJ48034.1 hypothetical protein C7H85_04345 [Zobellella endophytica]
MPIFSKDNKNILFIHVPKAGGSTIESIFKRSEFEMTYFDGGKHSKLNPLRKCSPQHMYAEQLNALFEVNKFDYIFMLVRNPIERFKSEFGMRHQQADKNNRLNFDYVNSWTKKTLENYNSNPYCYDNHIRPQSQFYLPGTRVFKLEDGMDSIIEQISKDISMQLNYDGFKIMDRKKKSGFSSKDVPISDFTLNHLEHFYAEDFFNFNYKK